MDPRASALVRQLRLEPHPEGGYFREISRSSGTVRAGDDRPERVAVTSICLLLAAGQRSRWHRVCSNEIWPFYEGEPLEPLVGCTVAQGFDFADFFFLRDDPQASATLEALNPELVGMA